MVSRTEPTLRAMPETVQTIFDLHDQRYSGLVGYFVAGDQLDENVFLRVGIQNCRPDV